MASGDEKFNVSGVKAKMGVIEGYFSDFATTLSDINAYIQTNVNASIESAAFGSLGGKLLSIWDYNASTFNDFHENFDNWAQVVAIIAANNNQFAVDALATYRDNAGTLDGVQEARSYVAANNGVSNSGSNYGTLSNAARSIIDSSIAQGSNIPEVTNMFGGKTVKEDDGTIKFYDANGNLVSYYKDGIYYDANNNPIGDNDAYNQWLIDNGYKKPSQQQQQPAQGDDIVLTEKNNFGGKTVQKEDGTVEFYDDKGNLIAYKKDGKFYEADNDEIGDQAAYEQWLKDNNYSSDNVVLEQENNFGGETVTTPEGRIEYRNDKGDLEAYYEDGKFYDANGKLIGDAEAYREWLTNNGHNLPKEGTLPGETPGQQSQQQQQQQQQTANTPDDVYNMYNDPNATAEDRRKAYDALSDEDKAIVDGKLAADFTASANANAMTWSNSDWSNYENLPDAAKAKILEDLGYSEITHKDNQYKAVKNDGTYLEEYRDGSGTVTKKISYDGEVTTTEDYNNKTTTYDYDQPRTVQGRENVKSYEYKNDAGNETKTFKYVDSDSTNHLDTEVVYSDGSYEKTYNSTADQGLKSETFDASNKETTRNYDSSKNTSGLKTEVVTKSNVTSTVRTYDETKSHNGLIKTEENDAGYVHKEWDSNLHPDGAKSYTKLPNGGSETTNYDPAKHDNISQVTVSGDDLTTKTTYGNGAIRTDIVDPNDSSKVTSTLTKGSDVYTIKQGTNIGDSIHHANTVYYASEKGAYVDAIRDLQPGDVLVVKASKLQLDPGNDGWNYETKSPASGSDSLVIHCTDFDPSSGKITFTVDGISPSWTYTKAELMSGNSVDDSTFGG